MACADTHRYTGCCIPSGVFCVRMRHRRETGTGTNLVAGQREPCYYDGLVDLRPPGSRAA